MFGLSFRGKMLVGFAVPLAISTIAGFSVFRQLGLTAKLGAEVDQIVAVREHLHGLGWLITDAETAERGYVITGSELFLASFGASVGAIPGRLRQLREALGGDPARLRAASRVGDLFDRWRFSVAEPVMAARSATPLGLADALETVLLVGHGLDGLTDPAPNSQASLDIAVRRLDELLTRNTRPLVGHKAGLRLAVDAWLRPTSASTRLSTDALLKRLAVELPELREAERQVTEAIATGRGKTINDQIRGLIGELLDATEQERHALADRVDDANRRGRLEIVFSILVVSFLSLGFALYASGRIANAARELATAARRLASGDMASRAVVRGRDELAALAQSFNAMATRIEDREREVSNLTQMADLLQSCRTVGEAIDVVGRLGPTLFPGSSGGLALVHQSFEVVHWVCRWPEGAHSSPIGFSPDDCWGLRTGHTYGIDTTGSTVPCRHVAADVRGTSICLPLVAQGETLGLLHLLLPPRTRDADSFTTHDAKLRLARPVAEQIALAIANLKLREALRDQAIRDPLTGLYNRRYMEESLDREVARALRTESSVAAVMIDVDHFKRFNDTHGHDAGDSLLRSIGQLLRSQVRGHDIACRYGGEEFVLILPETGVEEATHRAEDIRRAVQTMRTVHGGDTLGPLTVSLGVAAFPQNGESSAALMKAADTALYRSKEQGRDRTTVATGGDETEAAHG